METTKSRWNVLFPLCGIAWVMLRLVRDMLQAWSGAEGVGKEDGFSST